MRFLLAFLVLPFAAAATDLPRDTVVARQGTAEVTLADVDAQIAGLPREFRAGYMDDPQRIERLLHGLLTARQMADAAREQGLHEDPLFEARLQLLRDNLLMSMLADHHIESLKLPDFSVLAAEKYRANPDAFRMPESRDVRHISISAEKHGRERAREIASKLAGRLAAGESFDELARLYSDDEPAAEGPLAPPVGLLEGLQRGQTEQPFEDAAFALASPGQVSDPVETSYGFHVIRLESVTPAARVPFEAVKGRIEKQLRDEYLSERRNALIASFQSRPVEAEPEVVASLRTRYKDAGAADAAVSGR